MNKVSIKVLSCLMLSAFFICSQAVTYGSDDENVVYKYKYNLVPLKQPVVTANMKTAVAEYNKGNYLGAMVELKKVVEEDKNNTYAKYYLAICYANLGYKSQATDLYNDIINNGDSYALSYYSQRALSCTENSDDPICLPPKMVKAPDMTKYQKQTLDENPKENKSSDEQTDDIDIESFIRSGKKIHPATLDKITNERMKIKMQADAYAKKQAEQEEGNDKN